MRHDRSTSLETALAKTESDVDTVLKAATAFSSSLKRVRAAAHFGTLRELRPAIEAAEQALAALRQQFANVKGGWDFDEDSYFADGAFAQELRATADQKDVRIFELADRLYSYPVLIRVLPNDRSVLIDKRRERRVRPSVLVNLLKDLQRRPVRFKPEPLLESIYEAYTIIVAKRGKELFRQGVVVRLLDIYDLLTLLPGHNREYSRQEFARDLYLIDRSNVNRTKKGHVLSFSASTGAKSPSSTIRIITENGEEKVYYGISFTPVD